MVPCAVEDVLRLGEAAGFTPSPAVCRVPSARITDHDDSLRRRHVPRGIHRITGVVGSPTREGSGSSGLRRGPAMER